ncbi:hypothetical protein DL96DRAFT_1818387 [Flagelloscypha sp. PMI_526]|nr:hypothetical protein DL96DRAFT_1818387 [Flagelloscypha sp. PMI_526]
MFESLLTHFPSWTSHQPTPTSPSQLPHEPADNEPETKTPPLVAFPDLPVEIARLIVEYAALDNNTACKLCLASTDIQEWAEEILYRAVNVTPQRQVHLHRLFRDKPCIAIMVKRLYVWQITWSVRNIINYCPTLEFLGTHSGSFMATDLKLPSTVRGLSFSMPFPNEIDFNPNWGNITHLAVEIPYPLEVFVKWLGNHKDAGVKNLTHLFIKSTNMTFKRWRFEKRTTETFEKLSLALPSSCRLCIMWGRAVTRMTPLSPGERVTVRCFSGELDSRLCFASSMRWSITGEDDWTPFTVTWGMTEPDCVTGDFDAPYSREGTIWKAAERIQKLREPYLASIG